LIVAIGLCLALVLAACGGGESESRVTPLDIDGGGSAQFRVKGGDNSIQDSGREADRAELRLAALAAHDYFAALAQEEWSEACGRLAPATAEAASRLAASPKASGCGAALAVLFSPVTAAEGREATVVDAASLRRKGGHGFLLYRGAKGKPYFISLDLLHGKWAVSSLSPTGLH
jgi:hypothetical protein